MHPHLIVAWLVLAAALLAACTAPTTAPERANAHSYPDATLTLERVEALPTGTGVRLSQLRRDSTGPTSMRYYAPRTGMPTKVDDWAYRKGLDNGGTYARYYYRDRDLGQTFTTGDCGFDMRAVTVQLQPVDVARADPSGARVSLQLLRVEGNARINDNGTTAFVDSARATQTSPNGTSLWLGDGPYTGPCTNPRWSTYASDWPLDSADASGTYRWPVMHLSDDYLEGERYVPLAVASGGTIPTDLRLNDYLRWQLDGADWTLAPNTTYAFVLLFDEPAPPGVRRNLPLSNINVLPGGKSGEVFAGGHMIRRDGASGAFEDVFVRDTTDAADLAASRRSSSFPTTSAGAPDRAARLALPPGTLGYPDVDTYRDLLFVLEGDLLNPSCSETPIR